MIGPLLALCLFCGVALIVVGLVEEKREATSSRVGDLWWRGQQAGIVAPRFLLAVAAATLAGLLFGWALTGIPVLAVLGGFAGGYAPFVWLRRRNEQSKRGRARAWPAALAQHAGFFCAGSLAKRPSVWVGLMDRRLR